MVDLMEARGFTVVAPGYRREGASFNPYAFIVRWDDNPQCTFETILKPQDYRPWTDLTRPTSWARYQWTTIQPLKPHMPQPLLPPPPTPPASPPESPRMTSSSPEKAKTREVVLNKCSGSYRLSAETIVILVSRHGFELKPYEPTSNWPPQRHILQLEREPERHDPRLVSTVRELGPDRAGDDYTRLIIEETSEDHYVIDKVDGEEVLRTTTRDPVVNAPTSKDHAWQRVRKALSMYLRNHHKYRWAGLSGELSFFELPPENDMDSQEDYVRVGYPDGYDDDDEDMPPLVHDSSVNSSGDEGDKTKEVPTKAKRETLSGQSATLGTSDSATAQRRPLGEWIHERVTSVLTATSVSSVLMTTRVVRILLELPESELLALVDAPPPRLTTVIMETHAALVRSIETPSLSPSHESVATVVDTGLVQSTAPEQLAMTQETQAVSSDKPKSSPDQVSSCIPCSDQEKPPATSLYPERPYAFLSRDAPEYPQPENHAELPLSIAARAQRAIDKYNSVLATDKYDSKDTPLSRGPEDTGFKYSNAIDRVDQWDRDDSWRIGIAQARSKGFQEGVQARRQADGTARNLVQPISDPGSLRVDISRRVQEERKADRYIDLATDNLNALLADRDGSRCYYCLGAPEIHILSDTVIPRTSAGGGTVLCPLCDVDALVPASEVPDEATMHAWRYLAFFSRNCTDRAMSSETAPTRESKIQHANGPLERHEDPPVSGKPADRSLEATATKPIATCFKSDCNRPAFFQPGVTQLKFCSYQHQRDYATTEIKRINLWKEAVTQNLSCRLDYTSASLDRPTENARWFDHRESTDTPSPNVRNPRQHNAGLDPHTSGSADRTRKQSPLSTPPHNRSTSKDRRRESRAHLQQKHHAEPSPGQPKYDGNPSGPQHRWSQSRQNGTQRHGPTPDPGHPLNTLFGVHSHGQTSRAWRPGVQMPHQHVHLHVPQVPTMSPTLQQPPAMATCHVHLHLAPSPPPSPPSYEGTALLTERQSTAVEVLHRNFPFISKALHMMRSAPRITMDVQSDLTVQWESLWKTLRGFSMIQAQSRPSRTMEEEDIPPDPPPGPTGPEDDGTADERREKARRTDDYPTKKWPARATPVLPVTPAQTPNFTPPRAPSPGQPGTEDDVPDAEHVVAESFTCVPEAPGSGGSWASSNATSADRIYYECYCNSDANLICTRCKLLVDNGRTMPRPRSMADMRLPPTEEPDPDDSIPAGERRGSQKILECHQHKCSAPSTPAPWLTSFISCDRCRQRNPLTSSFCTTCGAKLAPHPPNTDGYHGLTKSNADGKRETKHLPTRAEASFDAELSEMINTARANTTFADSSEVAADRARAVELNEYEDAHNRSRSRKKAAADQARAAELEEYEDAQHCSRSEIALSGLPSGPPPASAPPSPPGSPLTVPEEEAEEPEEDQAVETPTEEADVLGTPQVSNLTGEDAALAPSLSASPQPLLQEVPAMQLPPQSSMPRPPSPLPPLPPMLLPPLRQTTVPLQPIDPLETASSAPVTPPDTLPETEKTETTIRPAGARPMATPPAERRIAPWPEVDNSPPYREYVDSPAPTMTSELPEYVKRVNLQFKYERNESSRVLAETIEGHRKTMKEAQEREDTAAFRAYDVNKEHAHLTRRIEVAERQYAEVQVEIVKVTRERDEHAARLEATLETSEDKDITIAALAQSLGGETKRLREALETAAQAADAAVAGAEIHEKVERNLEITRQENRDLTGECERHVKLLGLTEAELIESQAQGKELTLEKEKLVEYRKSLDATENGSVTDRVRERLRLEADVDLAQKKTTEAEQVIEQLDQERNSIREELRLANHRLTEQAIRLARSEEEHHSDSTAPPGTQPTAGQTATPRETPHARPEQRYDPKEDVENRPPNTQRPYHDEPTSERGEEDGFPRYEYDRRPERGDDEVSVAGSYMPPSENSHRLSVLQLYEQHPDTTMKALTKSPRSGQVRQVLKSKSDNSGQYWNTRSFWVPDVIEAWERKAFNIRSERGVATILEKLAKMRFDPKLKDQNPIVQAEAWEIFRTTLVTALRDGFNAGCQWEHMLQRLLNAAKQKETGNPRIYSYAKEALEDTVLLNDLVDRGGGYALLGADICIHRLDESFQAKNFGAHSDQNEWAKTIGRYDGEDLLTMNSRITSAYEKFSNIPGNVVHLNEHHRKIVFERIGICLENDPRDVQRGIRSHSNFLIGVDSFEEHIRCGDKTIEDMTSEKILRMYVLPIEKVKGYVKDPYDRHASAREESGNRRDTRARSDRSRSAVAGAVTPEWSPTGHQEGRMTAAVDSDTVAAIPGSQSTYSSAPAYRTEQPPSSYTGLSEREKKWGRECDPPAGSKGHPQGKNWNETDWKGAYIDYEKLCKMACEPQLQNYMNRFMPSNAQMSACRKELPKKNDKNIWGIKACLFCLYRSPNDPAKWRTGNGIGSHAPATCRIAKRWLCEGGDPETARISRDLQKCIIIRPPRMTGGERQPR